MAAALRFLSGQQHADGSFPPDWSSSRHHTVFRAALAATRKPNTPHRNGPGQLIIGRCQSLVLGSQNADGGWGQEDGAPSDALSTAYALITLTTLKHGDAPASASGGVAYLLTQQRADGSIHSVPDSIGPRPFAFTVPVLADIFTLLALGHLTHRTVARPLDRGQARDTARGEPSRV